MALSALEQELLRRGMSPSGELAQIAPPSTSQLASKELASLPSPQSVADSVTTPDLAAIEMASKPSPQSVANTVTGAGAAGAAGKSAAGAAFPVGEAIGAGQSLIGGLLTSAARRREQNRKIAAEQEKQGLAAQRSGIQRLTQGQAGALRNIISVFGRALRT